MTRDEIITIARSNHATAIDQADWMGGLDASLEAYEQNMFDTIHEKGGGWNEGCIARSEWRRLEAARTASPAERPHTHPEKP